MLHFLKAICSPSADSLWRGHVCAVSGIKNAARESTSNERPALTDTVRTPSVASLLGEWLRTITPNNYDRPDPQLLRHVLRPDGWSETCIHWCNSTCLAEGLRRSNGFWQSREVLQLEELRTSQIRRSARRRIQAHRRWNLIKLMWRVLAAEVYKGKEFGLLCVWCNSHTFFGRDSGRFANTSEKRKTGNLSRRTGQKLSQATRKQSKAGLTSLWCALF